MESLIIESNAKKQQIFLGVLFAVGIVFLMITRGVDIHQFSNETAAFFIGLLLFLLAIGAFIWSPLKEVTIIDSKERQIIIRSTRVFGTSEEIITTSTIEGARVAYIGKASNFIGNTYYISLHLINGTTKPLFLNAYYDGKFSARTQEERLNLLVSMLGISRLK